MRNIWRYALAALIGVVLALPAGGQAKPLRKHHVIVKLQHRHGAHWHTHRTAVGDLSGQVIARGRRFRAVVIPVD